ncbi:MAG TPA: DUF4215 domain-containing protein, partial [Polyangiaceae bacterium]|nr:DUF4215 domain-containing protein [Polyangiaceae bacterium]
FFGTAGFGGGITSGYFEACDDGNVASGDGCDASCAVEPGWSCWYDFGCHPIVCGDGFSDYPTEECDDANNVPNDGCTNCRYDGAGWGGSAGTGGVPTSGGSPSGGGGSHG